MLTILHLANTGSHMLWLAVTFTILAVAALLFIGVMWLAMKFFDWRESRRNRRRNRRGERLPQLLDANKVIR